MKLAAGLFSILLFINGIMLTFQYHVYSNQLTEEDKTFYYDQDIEVVYHKNKFTIRHHLNSLPESQVRLNWPAKSVKKECGNKQTEKCNRLNKTKTSLNKGKTKEQTFVYTIPAPSEGKLSGRVIKNIFLSLNLGKSVHTTIHITDKKHSGGQWITGLPEVKSKNLKLIQYSMFSGNGPVTSLYWQKAKMKELFTNDQVTLYGNGHASDNLAQALKGLDIEGFEHVAIIESKKYKKSGDRILFTSELNKKTLTEKYILSQMNQKYNFDMLPNWGPAVVASFLTERRVGSPKASKMVATLKDYMNEQQLKDWKTSLEDLQGKKITAGLLDDKLSSSLELKTSFFKMNAQNGNKVAPLLFEDKRPIYLNGLQQKNMQVILKDGRILYSVKPLLNKLGYSTKIGVHGFYAQSKERNFRFPMDEPFYVYNEHRYDLLSQPIVKYGSDYYIEEAWLVRLFIVDIEKSEKQINIKRQ